MVALSVGRLEADKTNQVAACRRYQLESTTAGTMLVYSAPLSSWSVVVTEGEGLRELVNEARSESRQM